MLTASALAEAIRTRQEAASEILEALLDRIEAYNPALNAIVILDAEMARRRAREANEALSRGYPPFANHIPAHDAPPVDRLRQAGAILLGKTNVPTLARGNLTINPVFGRANNPWDVRSNDRHAL
jgi:amidase